MSDTPEPEVTAAADEPQVAVEPDAAAAAEPEPTPPPPVVVELGEVDQAGREQALVDVAVQSEVGDVSWLVLRDGQPVATDQPEDGDQVLGRGDVLLAVKDLQPVPVEETAAPK